MKKCERCGEDLWGDIITDSDETAEVCLECGMKYPMGYAWGEAMKELSGYEEKKM